MKRLILAATITIFAGTTAAYAQFGSGIVYDPTQSAHAIQQISQGEQIFTNTVKLANNAIAAYNLARQMSIAPQSLYQPYLSPFTYWRLLNQAANTYGNSQPGPVRRIMARALSMPINRQPFREPPLSRSTVRSAPMASSKSPRKALPAI